MTLISDEPTTEPPLAAETPAAAGGEKQSKSETFISEAEARAAVEEMITEKFEDGFRELVGPGNRRFEFNVATQSGDWIDARDPEMYGAVLHIPESGQRLIVYCAAPGSSSQRAIGMPNIRSAWRLTNV